MIVVLTGVWEGKIQVARRLPSMGMNGAARLFADGGRRHAEYSDNGENDRAGGDLEYAAAAVHYFRVAG